MAAREHQGLQIALIIFVMLTIVLGVTSFWFFDQYKNEHIKSESNIKVAKKAGDDLKKTIDEMTELKQLMGFGVRDEVPAVVTAYKSDMEKYAKTFPQPNQHYRFIVADLDKELRKAKEQLVDRRLSEVVLEDKIKADESAKVVEVREYQTKLKTNVDDLTQERGKFNADREKAKKDAADIANKLESKRKELDEVASKAAKELEEALNSLQKMVKTNEALVQKDKDAEVSTEQSDGKITWVNQRARVVWVNLGADDGLRRQVSFAVIGADENNPLKADKKGSVEVTRVLDRHLAEARIIDDSPSNPIMPGDNVFSAAWQPGRAEHFALAGKMDVDKDGLSDRQRIRDLITLNGGVIDAEVNDDGTRIGDLTVQTRYLVLGDRPDDKNTNTDLLANYSKLIGDAKSMPIKTISVPELMDYLGYEAKERTIPLGADSKGSDFKPRAPEGVQRKSSNNMFKPRRATPTGGVKSSY
jgi:hypothetical protein